MILSSDQQSAYDKIISGKNVFLTGKAGTGKSTVLKKCIDFFAKEKKNVAVLASTGIAASNIGGQTLHSFFKLPINGVSNYEKCFYVKKDTRLLWDKTDIVIIDEVSMLRADVADSIMWTLNKNNCESYKKKQFIFVGDLSQLPPVVNSEIIKEFEGMYSEHSFNCSKFYKNLNCNEFSLTTIHRQSDIEFITNLNIIRTGGKSDYFKRFVSDKPKGLILCPHKSTVSFYNNSELEKLDSEIFESTAIIKGDKVKIEDFNLEKNLLLKSGAKVMYLKNDFDRGLFNGLLGELRISNGKLYLITKFGEFGVKKDKFVKKEYYIGEEGKLLMREIGYVKQYPLTLAYALTIHKSQGLTFDELTLDLTKRCFEKGQLYTALSRVRTPEGLKIIIE